MKAARLWLGAKRSNAPAACGLHGGADTNLTGGIGNPAVPLDKWARRRGRADAAAAAAAAGDEVAPAKAAWQAKAESAEMPISVTRDSRKGGRKAGVGVNDDGSAAASQRQRPRECSSGGSGSKMDSSPSCLGPRWR